MEYMLCGSSSDILRNPTLKTILLFSKTTMSTYQYISSLRRNLRSQFLRSPTVVFFLGTAPSNNFPISSLAQKYSIQETLIATS